MADLPPAFWQGVQEFQQGQFYACHDTLEALWMEASEPDRTFFQGILQLAVACYHLSHQNGRGAVILLGEGIRRLSPYQPVYGGLDVDYLLDTSSHLLQQLQQASPEQILAYSQQIQRIGVSQSVQDSEGVPMPILRLRDAP